MIFIHAPDRNTNLLKDTLQGLLPEVKVFNEAGAFDPNAIKMAVLWKQESGVLDGFDQLQAIHSLGAGVDHLIDDPGIPPHLPIARVVDPNLTRDMCRYVVMAVLNFHKNTFQHLDQQRRQQWSGLSVQDQDLKIGVMGMGQLGEAVAQSLHQLGFKVVGLANRPKQLSGIPVYATQNQELTSFLAQVNTLVCVLPLTPATKSILNKELFNHLPPQSYLINVGRGQHLVEEDLIEALEVGKIAGAYLDVLSKEPLPPIHPFWTHPKIILTPHIASVTNQATVALQIAENYKRLISGKQMIHQINRKEGY